jgi:hypothetical protein
MRSFALTALLALAALAPAAPVPKTLKKKDGAALLVGTWKPDKGSEWFAFDGEGGMKAWSTGNEARPVLYTFAIDPEPDGRPWRMFWSQAGQPKPSFQAVFVVDGDRLYLTYSGATAQPAARPDSSAAPNFTRHTSDK